MYLSKLELFGFKSFAHKTVVNFNKGVTAIVGPNGCGKTNIVDALRWCLGEQKSSTLRSDKMENVIFNGTQNKKPMGMAEVSLTLVNDNGVLPTEYSEVTITRRIFRSGESEYLLNRNICRLKDITNLFMDTGMSTNAYSVIELKMVENILSNKADERRNMFEEAAGVNKYKLRRRITLKKLEEVRKDLTRVNDIVSEVEKKVNSLERQAKKADKYNKLTSILREQELDLAHREYFLHNARRDELKIRKDEASGSKIRIESEVRRLDDELVVFREEISRIENELKDKRREISIQTEKIHSVENRISVAEERRKSLEKNLGRYKQELEELHMQSEDNEDLIVETQDKIAVTARTLQLKESGIEESKQALNDRKTCLEEKKAQLKEHRDSIFIKFKDITNKENQLQNLKKSLDNTAKTIEKLKSRLTSLSEHQDGLLERLEKSEAEKSEAEEKLRTAERNYHLKQNEKEELEKQLNQLREKELEEKNQINNIKNKIDFLQTLLNNLEGVSKGSKKLIENVDWTAKEKTLLADVGDAEDKYRFALEAALKVVLNNLLLETADDLKNAVSFLKDNDLGKASFYVLSLKKPEKRTLLKRYLDYNTKKIRKKIEAESLFLGWAEQFIQTEDRWRPYFSKVLNNIIIVSDLDSALQMNSLYPGYSFATLGGDYLHETGIVEAGAEQKLDDTLFGRRQMLENLKSEYPAFEQRLEHLMDEISSTESALSEINLKELADQSRIALNDLAGIEKQIAQYEFEKKKYADEIEKLNSEVSELVNHSAETENEYGKNQLELEEYRQIRRQADEELAAFEAEVKNHEADYSQALSASNQLKLELERLKGEKKNLENSVERAEQSRINIKRSIEKRETDITSTSEEIIALTNEIEDKQFDLDDLRDDKRKLVAVETEIDTSLRKIKGEASVLEKSLHEYRKERDTVSDAIHSADIKINEINLKLDNLFERIKDEYSVTLELKEFEDIAGYNFQLKTNEVHALKQQVKALGPINLLAYSEYEEEKERLDFLQKQRNDLIESEKDLIKTIEEINVTAQTLFMETFQQIRENFIRIFRTLFNPGDEADLRLEENVDPLESKIEIIAKPKGKRPTSIELLSGGEKTLTATALLFSIYLVKPSPFCILDEVDAPLDDANVDRFTRIIHDFSKSTQFIIVTHNKRTMEAAETMYGVTIQEEGISKLVSVRFNEDFDEFIR